MICSPAPSNGPAQSRVGAARLLALSALGSVVATSLVIAGVPAQAAPAAPATGAGSSPAAFQTVPARTSESLVDGYGIGIHAAYWNSPYGDTARVASALADLGVEHVRDDLWNNTPESYVAINQIAHDADVKFDLIMGNPSRGQAPVQYVNTVKTKLLGSVEAIEGPNEWDNFGPSNWVNQLRTFQADLYAAAKADPATAHLPVLAPALAFRDNYAALGTQTGVADVGNSHLYPGGRNPSVDIDAAQEASESRTGTSGTVVTEAGYQNALNTTSGHHPVPEDVAGIYLPRMLAEHALAGTERLYTYELIDGAVDPSLTDIEAHFGLLRHDWTPKPAYNAMKNLLAVLDDSDAPFTPGRAHLLHQRGQRPAPARHPAQRRHLRAAHVARRLDLVDRLQEPHRRVARGGHRVVPREPRRRRPAPRPRRRPSPHGRRHRPDHPARSQLVALEISEPESVPDLPELPDLPSLPDVLDVPGLPEVPVTPVVDAVTAAVSTVLATPGPRSAKVRWKLDKTPSAQTPTKWRVKVFRGTKKVRTISQPADRRAVRVRNLSPSTATGSASSRSRSPACPTPS